jgi:tetratricopeptide (TPR) repeat protein
MNSGTSIVQRSPRDFRRWQEAQQLLYAGSHAEAVSIYRKLVMQYPGVAELWLELGNAHAGNLDFDRAHDAYRRTLSLAPDNPSLLVMVAQQYQGLRRLDEARTCFEQAVRVSPESIDARISLAVWLEKERRIDDARECVEACLRIDPSDDQARYFGAFLDHRSGANAAAETALRDLIKSEPRYPYVQHAARHLLGVVLDQLGQPAGALRWLDESKRIVRKLADCALLETQYDASVLRRRELLGALTPGSFRRWREDSPQPEFDDRFAFLGGHPRSGTTLVEQVLDAHPGVMAFDEPDSFSREASGLFDLQGPGADVAAAMDRLGPGQITAARSRYLKSLLREARKGPDTRVLVDKNPSVTGLLPLFLRIFPELRVVIALRDPRDVVVSCYFQSLMLNGTNVNFLSLERTAKHYADLMDTWLRLREIGGFDWIETRYEDVVDDLELEGRKVTEFLGLEWQASQSRFHENSRWKFLHAPTYHDVTQPVYRRALKRWERYAEALAPLQARLAPYLQAFGYAA